MFDDFDDFLHNGTWDLSPPDDPQNLVVCKWVYRVKCKHDGFVDRFKARLVAKGFHQQPTIDFHETFRLMAKPMIVHLVNY